MTSRFILRIYPRTGRVLGLCLLVCTSADSQSVLTGRVSDAESGKPLESANVFLSSTTIGTGTSPDGTYRLVNVPSGVLLLVASRVGYTLSTVDSRLQFLHEVRDLIAAELS